ncbi:MAG: CotS family spore coat protein [Clostridium sp.]|uniref:CotS family spore coat protein n=1 Tax=Clostridium sp. TaxID=1506 RepID=UPI00304AD77E
METRFSHKEWLSRYSLDVDLLDNYDFLVTDVIPLRKVFVLVTDRGNKILKKVHYEEEDIRFIKSGMEYMKNNGFNRIMNFIVNKNGHIITKWKESTYVVMELIEGRECEYNNPLDIAIAVNGLSDMHNASKGISFSSKSKRYMPFKAIDNYRDKFEDLQRLKERAISYENKNEFHDIFLRYVDGFLEDMKKSIDIMEKSTYLEMCNYNENFILCHGDLAYHNIIIEDNKSYFIDFDYSTVDLRVNDICNIINKVTKNSCYDFNILKLIIDEYNKDVPLGRDEYEVLYGMLSFPTEFYSIAKDYFYRKKLWKYETYLYKIKKKVQDIDERQEMIENFKNLYVMATV